jgi:hypothetical protein
MQDFQVRCFTAGKWDEKEPRGVRATDEKEAAEKVCGCPLKDAGPPGKLRAEVYRSSSPGVKKMFYDE